MTEKEQPMDKKICLVTGATSGIGEATALELARVGATVIVVGRNPEKCTRTVTNIQKKTGNTAVSHLVADLSSQTQIRVLVKEFITEYDHLDVLVNNAGGVFVGRQLSVDGIEMTLALNHLNYFLLTNLLLDSLKAARSARVVNVSSGAHRRAKFDLDDLQLEHDYSAWKAYRRSKFANILFTYQLARRLEEENVAANALHPGLVVTNVGSNAGLLVRWGFRLFAWLRGGLTPEEGARTSVYLASSPEVEAVSGRYFVKCEAASSAPGTYHVDKAEKLWQISAQLTGLAD